MKLTCFVVDDEISARQGIIEYIRDTPFLEICGETADAVKAAPLLDKLKPDILFLDIQMKAISGLDFIKLYKPEMHVIMTTAYSEYAIEGFELQVSDYLLKPIAYDRFYKSVARIYERAVKQEVKPDDAFIFIRSEGVYRKIYIREILFIQSLQNYVTFHLKNSRIVALLTLKTLEKRLLAFDFIKIQKKYIVNPRWVNSVDGNELLVEGHRLPVSRDLKNTVYNRLLNGRYIK